MQNVEPNLVDFTELSLIELKSLGFMRWGRAPIPNLWLIPEILLATAAPGQTFYGIDGKPYVVGMTTLSRTALFGRMAYGVKVESDSKEGLKESPIYSSYARLEGKSLQRMLKKAKRIGVFLP